MEVTDGQTETLIALEPTAGSDHVNGGRAKGKLPGEYQLAMVEASVIRGVFRPANLKINVTFHKFNPNKIATQFPFDIKKKAFCRYRRDRRG